MQDQATKVITTASYNDDGQNGPIKEKVLSQIEREVEKGYRFLNHVFLRDTHAHRDTKFNFLLAGNPLIAYALLNVSKTSFTQNAIVGDDITKLIVEAFSDFFKDDRSQHVDEGPSEDWSLSNTLIRGVQTLNTSEGELSLALMGDTPLAWNLDPILKDPDITDYDAILDLNTRQKVGRHFPRYYHFKIRHKGLNFFAKEPNLYLFDASRVAEVADLVYSGRKTNMNKGRKDIFLELFFNNGKWRGTFTGLGPLYSAQLAYTFARGTIPLLKPQRAKKAIKNALGLNILFKADNNQPGTLQDMDALEDWAYLNQIIEEDRDSVYPYYSELKRFSDAVMPELRRQVPMYQNFPDYMNNLFQELDLPLPFPDGKTFTQPFTSGPVRRMLKRVAREHRRYNRRHALEVKPQTLS
jgi:hypothetical protein